MSEKKNQDILTISNKNNFRDNGNLESSAQRGKYFQYII